jgi:transposase
MNVDIDAQPHRNNFKEIVQKLDECVADGVRVIFVDEAVFTFNTF